MTKLLSIVLVALTSFFLYVEGSAGEANPQLLENRAAFYGGYGLNIGFGLTCPSGTYSCQAQDSPDQQIGGPCCPDVTYCVVDSQICCPTPQDCSSQVINGPTCADPTWNLLARSDSQALYSCCASDEVVDIGGQCQPPNQSGISAQDTTFQTFTQANNAAPSGSNTNTVNGGDYIVPSNLGAAATTTGAGSTPTSGGGSTPAGGAATATATKNSAANKNFLAGSSAALACLLVVVSVLF